MVLFFVSIYLLLTLSFSLWSSRRVHTADDFALAGSRMPLAISACALFATWFGSETILGASAEFAAHGLYAVIEDPFGTVAGLVLIGAFFAKRLYRLNLLTINDLFRIRYGRRIEVLSSVLMAGSFFGWIAGQLVALGIILAELSGWDRDTCIIFSAVFVTFYTVAGGMLSISLNDAVQTVVIIAGLAVMVFRLADQAPPLQEITATLPPDFFQFLPEPGFVNISAYVEAWITVGLGAVASQDVFQRVMSAKNERVAASSAYVAAGMYAIVAMFPLVIGLYARYLFPGADDMQEALPRMVLRHADTFTAVIFFGALLSAIVSTAAGAMLAPGTVMAENLLKPLMNRKLTDAQQLLLMRVCVVFAGVVSLVFALSGRSIYELVAESSGLALVSLFVPTVAALSYAHTRRVAAGLSMLCGIGGWVWFYFADVGYPPILFGLAASLVGFGCGHLLPEIDITGNGEQDVEESKK